MNQLIFEDLKLIRYKNAWDYQINLFDSMLTNKNAEIKNNSHYLLFCEHPHVFTIGKHGNQSNLLVNSEKLESEGIEFFNIDRGGDITYHGPGQLVVYPIFDLDEFGINTREYVYRLEESVIQTLNYFSIYAERLPGAAGIWLDPHINGKSRKICAIGVKSSRRITMHGLALNVTTDLSYFNYMNPCGFIDKGVSSIQAELGKPVDLEIIKSILKENFLAQFNL
jgi:lipoyl(octanoyl) transferase